MVYLFMLYLFSALLSPRISITIEIEVESEVYRAEWIGFAVLSKPLSHLTPPPPPPLSRRGKINFPKICKFYVRSLIKW